MRYDPDKVRENARKAETEDLLDRVTVYRVGMEPDALYAIEEELRRRGVTAADIDAHARRRQEAGVRDDVPPARCGYCDRPAVARGWGWHRLWGRWWLPVFPRPVRYCEAHRPGGAATSR
ncbi:MAG TPA: hypothetical protein VFW33_18520 [Gemmataceae bacterium]|nr:hypothetical protein [Gemmataceae bacterium]